MLCNSNFPELSNNCNHPEAVYRRRKFLINVALRPDIVEQYPHFKDASDLPRDVLERLEHLQFSLAENVRDPNTQYGAWMTYAEFMPIVQTRFRKHYEDEEENFKQRMKDMYFLDDNFDETNVITEIPELEQKVSLSEQIEAFKYTIQQKLDNYNDPQREPEVWDKIRDKLESWKILRAKPQMDTSAIADIVAGPSVEAVMSPESFENNFPELTAHISQYVFTDERKSVFSKIRLFDDTKFIRHIYDTFGALSSGQLNLLEDQLFRTIDVLFGGMENSYLDASYRTCISEYLEKGCFSILEQIKFLLLFPQTVPHVLNIVFDLDVECNMHSLVERCRTDVRQLSSVVNDVVTYNNLDKKRLLRSALKKMNTLSQKASFDMLWKLSFEALLESDSILGGYSEFYSALSILKKVPSFKNFEIAFHNAYHIARSCPELIQRLLNLFSIYIFFTGLLCGDSIDSLEVGVSVCHCKAHDTFSHCAKYIEQYKFCSVRLRLEYLGRDISMCEKECLYNNPMLYYLLALGACSCKLKARTSFNTFGREEIALYEVDDVHRALRKRTAKFSHSLFSRFARFMKHLFLHKLPEAVSTLISVLWNRLPMILFSLAGMLVGSGALALTNSFFGESSLHKTQRLQREHAAAQANYFKFNVPKHQPTARTSLHPKGFGSGAKFEMSADNRMVLGKFIERNAVILYVTWVEESGRQVRSCRCLMIKGRSMLVLRHYLEEYAYLVTKGFKIECKLFFSKNKGTEVASVSINWEDIISNVAWCSSDSEKLTSNYGIVMLPKFVPQFKDISKRFATKAEHQNSSSSCDLYVINGESSFNLATTKRTNFMVSSTAASSAVYVDTVYSYHKQYPGLCGSVLVSPNLGSGLGSIIGIHIAGSSDSGVGYAEPIYRELFDCFFLEFPQVDVMDPIVNSEIKPDFELDSNLIYYGCVPQEFAHKESGKTKIVPSLLHGTVYPVKTEVNPLRPHDPRQPPGSHPLRDGCNKHGTGDVKVFDTELLEEVKEIIQDKLHQVVKPTRVEVQPLSLQQAVCGDVNLPYFESLNWKSSEGFPLSSKRPKSAKDKRWLFDLEEGEFGYQLKGLKPELQAQLKLRDLCFKNKVKPPTVYVDCLKDYRLTPEKCAQPGKTRIFSIAPVQCSIDMRQYLTDFTASLKNSRIVNSIAIGINPLSLIHI